MQTMTMQNLTEIFLAISESRWRLKRVILPGMAFFEYRNSSGPGALRKFLKANEATVEVLVRNGSYVPWAPGLLEVFGGLNMPELWRVPQPLHHSALVLCSQKFKHLGCGASSAGKCANGTKPSGCGSLEYAETAWSFDCWAFFLSRCRL